MNEFDKEIKKKLSQYQSKVDNTIWDKIAQELPNEGKSSNPWLLFGIVSIVGLIAISSLIWYTQTSSDTAIMPLDKTTVLPSHQATPKINAEVATITKNDVGQYAQESKLSFMNAHMVKSNLTPSGSEHITDHTRLNMPNRRESSSKSDDTVANESQNNIKNSSAETEKSALVDSKAIATKQVVTVYDQYNSILKKTKSNNPTDYVEREIEGEVPNLTENFTLVESALNVKKKMELATVCPTFKAPLYHLYAEWVYVNQLPLATYTQSNSSLESPLAKLRNKSESPNYSFSTGFRMGLLTHSGLGIKSGVDYYQIHNKFSYIDPNHAQQKTIIIKEYIWENNEIVDSTIRTEQIDVLGKYTLNTRNTYRALNIPVLMTYEFWNNKKLSLDVNAGPVFNVLFKTNGFMIDAGSALPIAIEERPNQAYKSNVGVALQVGTSLNYNLGNGIEVFSEAQIYKPVSPITASNNPVDVKLNILGLGFGVRKHFK